MKNAVAIPFLHGHADGRRYGKGWCQAVASRKIDSCRYKDGRAFTS